MNSHYCKLRNVNFPQFIDPEIIVVEVCLAKMKVYVAGQKNTVFAIDIE